MMDMRVTRPAEFDRELVRIYPRVVKQAYAYCRNWTLAEDLTQEAILKALAHWEQFRPGTNLIGWVTTIVRNVHLDHHRKIRREVEDPDNIMASLIPVSGAQDDTAELRCVIGQIAAFPDESRGTFIGCVLNGNSIEEQMAIDGTPAGTVKSRVFYGRRRLREAAR
jgi:RNA polymerase sigma-70 factor (ECF subfamily)